MTGAQPVRNDQIEAFADRLAFGETEDAGRRRVPEPHPALRVGIDDCIGRAKHEPGREIVGQSCRQRSHGSLLARRAYVDTATTRQALQTAPRRRAIAVRDAFSASEAVRALSQSPRPRRPAHRVTRARLRSRPTGTARPRPAPCRALPRYATRNRACQRCLACSQARPMLSGPRQSTTGIIGQRNTPTLSTVAAAIAEAAGPGAPCAMLRSPVAKVSPTTAAATPSSMSCSVLLPVSPA